MQYATLLALVAAALGVEAKIAFTHVPGSSVTAGEPFSLEWDGATDDAPVTITLKKGDSTNLQTVALLTGNAKDGHYVWTPSKSLANADDYALEISQGVDETNYSGEFALKGGKAAAATTYGAATTVTITSGAKTYLTTESGGASSGTGAAKTTTRTSNQTVTSASPTSGGINVSNSPTPSAPASTSSTGMAAVVAGPVGGLAALLLGAVALL